MQAAQVAQHSQQGSAGLVRPQRLRLLHVRFHEPVLPLHALLSLHTGQQSALMRSQCYRGLAALRNMPNLPQVCGAPYGPLLSSIVRVWKHLQNLHCNRLNTNTSVAPCLPTL